MKARAVWQVSTHMLMQNSGGFDKANRKHRVIREGKVAKLWYPFEGCDWGQAGHPSSESCPSVSHVHQQQSV